MVAAAVEAVVDVVGVGDVEELSYVRSEQLLRQRRRVAPAGPIRKTLFCITFGPNVARKSFKFGPRSSKSCLFGLFMS